MTQVKILLYLNRMNKRLRHENPPPKEKPDSVFGEDGSDEWEFDGVPVRLATSAAEIADALGPG